MRGRVKFRVGRIVFLSFSKDGTVMGFGFPKEWRIALVEPIMMIGVGIMVGIVIIAMYLPMFKMLTLVK